MYNTDNLKVAINQNYIILLKKLQEKCIKTYLNTDSKVDTIKTFGNFPFRNF